MANDNALDLERSASELAALSKADLARRKAAAKRTISATQLQRGDVDAIKALTTTLGGVERAITREDLETFKRLAKQQGRRFEGGITARQVVDMSTAIDRKRARTEITVSVPTIAKTVMAGRGIDSLEVRFVTNASMKYAAKRHHVTVQFLGFSEAVTSGAASPEKAAILLKKGKLRFDCDCGRHTFWYRYIASIGKFNAGRPEEGYPKVRNPNLTGVACKHVLRTMAEVQSSSMISTFLSKAIAKARDAFDAKIRVEAGAAAKKEAAKQAKRPKGSGKGVADRDYERSRDALRQKSRSVTTAPKIPAKGNDRVKKEKERSKKDKNINEKLLAALVQLGLTPAEAIERLRGLE